MISERDLFIQFFDQFMATILQLSKTARFHQDVNLQIKLTIAVTVFYVYHWLVYHILTRILLANVLFSVEQK
jgi:hypothetical protein